MPTYDYVCDSCGHETAVFQSISEDPLRDCPECHEPKLRRRIGAGAGIIFKGSGFYETDYKRNRSNGNGGKKNDAKPASDSKPKSDPPKKPAAD